MAKGKQDSGEEKTRKKKVEKEKQQEETLAHDQDSEAPRTAQPPGEEPEWQRDEGC